MLIDCLEYRAIGNTNNSSEIKPKFIFKIATDLIVEIRPKNSVDHLEVKL